MNIYRRFKKVYSFAVLIKHKTMIISLFHYTLINGFYAVPTIFQSCTDTCDGSTLINRAPENTLYEPWSWRAAILALWFWIQILSPLCSNKWRVCPACLGKRGCCWIQDGQFCTILYNLLMKRIDWMVHQGQEML